MGWDNESPAQFRARIHAYEAGPVWAARSQAFRRTHGPYCQACGRQPPPRDLHAHHVTYDNAFGGREPDRDLRALCKDCHAIVHKLAREQHLNLRVATDRVIEFGLTPAESFPDHVPSVWARGLRHVLWLLFWLAYGVLGVGWVVGTGMNEPNEQIFALIIGVVGLLVAASTRTKGRK